MKSSRVFLTRILKSHGMSQYTHKIYMVFFRYVRFHKRKEERRCFLRGQKVNGLNNINTTNSSSFIF